MTSGFSGSFFGSSWGFAGGCGFSISSCLGFSFAFTSVFAGFAPVIGMAGAGVGCATVLFGCVRSGMPLSVRSEPIHPIMPRYIMCMQVATSGAKAWPKAATRSCVPSMLISSERSQKALRNVNANSPTPMKRTISPLISGLSILKQCFLLDRRMVENNIKYSVAINNIQHAL